MSSHNLFFSQLAKNSLHFIPSSTFEELEHIVSNLKKQYENLEASLEEERETNVDERYEEEIQYLQEQLSYCPIRLNKEQYDKYRKFLEAHSHCQSKKEDFHYAFYFSPTSIGMAADLQCKHCGEGIEILGTEDW